MRLKDSFVKNILCVGFMFTFVLFSSRGHAEGLFAKIKKGLQQNNQNKTKKTAQVKKTSHSLRPLHKCMVIKPDAKSFKSTASNRVECELVASNAYSIGPYILASDRYSRRETIVTAKPGVYKDKFSEKCNHSETYTYRQQLILMEQMLFKLKELGICGDIGLYKVSRPLTLEDHVHNPR